MRATGKRKRREASCCSLLVVNGGGGLRRLRLASRPATRKGRAEQWATTAFAVASSGSVACFSLPSDALRHGASSPCQRISLASKIARSVGARRAATVQYSTFLKAVISRSRSTIIRSATVCTRPAERPRRTRSQRSGETR